MLSEQDIIWHLCDPHQKTPYGEGFTYKKFMVWVKHFLAPYMRSHFVVEEYYEGVIMESWNSKNSLQQLPRGHTKTEMIGIWKTIYIAVYQPTNPHYLKNRGKEKQMTEQLLIAGAADDLNAWSGRIKEFFDMSPMLQKFKPAGAKSDKTTQRWNNRTLVLNNGHKIHLRTVKSRIRGLHVDRICADDLITESSTLTDKQTIAIWDGAVDGTSTSFEAMIDVIGTPLRYTDIQFHLKNKPEAYFFSRRPAIIDEENKVVLSPKRRNYANLMATKLRIGSTKFSAEYMLNPIDDSVSLIKRVHFRSCLDNYFEGVWLKPRISKTKTAAEVKFDKRNMFDFNRREWEEIWVTVDFAFSDRETADHTVMSIYGVRSGKLYKLGFIRNPDKEGWSSGTQLAIMEALKDYLGVSMFGLEENSIKGIIGDLKRYDLPVKLFEMSGKDPSSKYKEGPEYHSKRNVIGKIPSIERLDAAYERQRFILPYKTELDQEMMDLQEEETVSWAKEDGKLVEIGRHPDIPITDIIANEMMIQYYEGESLILMNEQSPITDEDYDEDTRERVFFKAPKIIGAGD